MSLVYDILIKISLEFYREPCGQSYKPSMLVNYDSRVVSISNLQVVTTLEL